MRKWKGGGYFAVVVFVTFVRGGANVLGLCVVVEIKARLHSP